MADKGSMPWKANDGQYGTMVWKSSAPKRSNLKPWIEIRFPEPRLLNRYRHSSNREYYFETDYLEQNGGSMFPTYRVSVQQPDGSWNEVAASNRAKKFLEQQPELKAAADQLHALIAELSEQGPRHSFVGRFKRPGPTPLS